MRAWSPIYEGDSIIHCGAQAALPEITQPAPAGPSLWARVGCVAAGFFRWLEKGAERARYRELESYLAESSDVFDLERRIRNVERSHGGMFDPYS